VQGRPTRETARYDFGPTNASKFATLARRAIDTFFQLLRVNSMPSCSHVAQQSCLMSAETCVKKQRGYSFPAMRFSTRQPSEWMSPRRKRSACRSTMASCQGSSSMRRACFGPGPCCGIRHGHAREYELTTASRR
jgi:hypothetical protein